MEYELNFLIINFHYQSNTSNDYSSKLFTVTWLSLEHELSQLLTQMKNMHLI